MVPGKTARLNRHQSVTQELIDDPVAAMRQRIAELEAEVADRTAAAGGGRRSGTPADGAAAAAAPSGQAGDPAERCQQLEASLARAEAALQQRASEAAAESSSFQQREAALASGNQSAQVLPAPAASCHAASHGSGNPTRSCPHGPKASSKPVPQRGAIGILNCMLALSSIIRTGSLQGLGAREHVRMYACPYGRTRICRTPPQL